jgi:hypothetical protein
LSATSLGRTALAENVAFASVILHWLPVVTFLNEASIHQPLRATPGWPLAASFRCWSIDLLIALRFLPVTSK